MGFFKNRHLRRADRLGDRLQKQFSEILSPYLVTEDDTMLRKGDWIIEDDIMIQISQTVKDVALPQKADYWIIEDQVVILATDGIRDDILAGKRKDYIVIQDDLMVFGDITIRDDVLRTARSGWIIEDDVMIMLTAKGSFSIASVHHSEPPQKNRNLFLISHVSDDREVEQAFSGLLKGDYDEKGMLQEARLVDRAGKELRKVRVGTTGAENRSFFDSWYIIIEDDLMISFSGKGGFSVGMPWLRSWD